MNKKEKQQYIDIIKPMLTQKRFEHSLNVSEEAVKLAKKYGADTEKAELAVFHSKSRCFSAKMLTNLTGFRIFVCSVRHFS